MFSEIYEWAGEYRTAELFLPQTELQFCRSKHIAASMANYEREYLSKFTPLPKNKLDFCAEALAKLHAEFIIIHPFRDGNGRTGRYMIDSLLVQVGLDSIDWNTVFHKAIADYHKGIQQSVSRDYSLLASLFREFMNS
ncbi:Fic family protein [bacterium]|nr:Fic family protein [bacterium]